MKLVLFFMKISDLLINIVLSNQGFSCQWNHQLLASEYVPRTHPHIHHDVFPWGITFPLLLVIL